jgi:DNA-binding XRE family transcriptional regulator
VGTVIQYAQGGKAERTQRWDRAQRAERLDVYRALQAQGVSQRQAAKVLDVPRTTLQAWRAWQDSIDACPRVVEFFDSVPGLAFLHRLVMALHVVFVEIGRIPRGCG